MADDDKIVFSADLDAADFISKLTGIKSEMLEIGSESTLGGLIKGLSGLAGPIAIVAAGIFGIRAAINLAFEGEQIEQVNRQFEMLTDTAGIAGESLKEGMIKAAQGTMDETDLLKAANEAIIRMGSSAKRLPEIMEIARKATATMGGTVAENFERLTTAIETGRARTLRAYGITVSATKAQEKFAESHGHTAKVLTETGKQQAFVNAAIDAGNVRFANASAQQGMLRTEQQKFTVALKEAKEALALLATELAPFFTTCLHGFAGIAKGAKDFLIAIGGGTESQRAKGELKNLKLQIDDVKEGIFEMKKASGAGEIIDTKMLKRAEAGLAALEEKAKKLQETLAKKTEKKEAGPDKSGDPNFDRKAEEKEEQKFQQALLDMRKKGNQEQIKLSKNLQDTEKLRHRELELLDKEYELKKKKIDEEYVKGSRQRNLMEIQLNKEKTAKIKALKEEEKQDSANADKNMVASGQFSAKAYAAAWRKASREQTGDMKLSAAVMQKSIQSFQGAADKAFKAMGEGGKSASQIAKEAVLGMIGEMASASGEFMMADSFKTFPTVNVVEFAAGGALVALGSALGASAKGSGSPSSGGDSGAAASMGSDMSTSATSADTSKKKSVSLVVHGSLYQTRETSRALIDMMKDELDVTDYKMSTVT
jgi:hypothetical protein